MEDPNDIKIKANVTFTKSLTPEAIDGHRCTFCNARDFCGGDFPCPCADNEYLIIIDSEILSTNENITTEARVTKLGDDRILFNEETYVNEKSNRVSPINDGHKFKSELRLTDGRRCLKDDYIKAKTLDLIESGFPSVTEETVRKLLDQILSGNEADLNVIGQLMKDDIQLK